jgi:hypothetical protein
MATMKQTESVANPAEQRGGDPVPSDYAEIQLGAGTVRYRDLGRGDPSCGTASPSVWPPTAIGRSSPTGRWAPTSSR